MKADRHIYLDFPDFTQENCYDVTSKVTFENGIEDEVKITVVCDDAYNAMKMVKEFLLSKKDWIVTEVRGQSYEARSLLIAKPEDARLKYTIVCDDIKRIFYSGRDFEEIKHYYVIQTIPDEVDIYHGIFNEKEVADKYCAELNKEWDERCGE